MAHELRQACRRPDARVPLGSVWGQPQARVCFWHQEQPRSATAAVAGVCSEGPHPGGLKDRRNSVRVPVLTSWESVCTRDSRSGVPNSPSSLGALLQTPGYQLTGAMLLPLPASVSLVSGGSLLLSVSETHADELQQGITLVSCEFRCPIHGLREPRNRM